MADRFSHIVSEGEEDKGLVYQYEWARLAEIPELAAQQGAFLGKLRRF